MKEPYTLYIHCRNIKWKEDEAGLYSTRTFSSMQEIKEYIEGVHPRLLKDKQYEYTYSYTYPMQISVHQETKIIFWDK